MMKFFFIFLIIISIVNADENDIEVEVEEFRMQGPGDVQHHSMNAWKRARLHGKYVCVCALRYLFVVCVVWRSEDY